MDNDDYQQLIDEAFDAVVEEEEREAEEEAEREAAAAVPRPIHHQRTIWCAMSAIAYICNCIHM